LIRRGRELQQPTLVEMQRHQTQNGCGKAPSVPLAKSVLTRCRITYP
jgi:hypothetical protein